MRYEQEETVQQTCRASGWCAGGPKRDGLELESWVMGKAIWEAQCETHNLAFQAPDFATDCVVQPGL